MYAGLYLLEPRTRTPRGDDDGLRHSGSASRSRTHGAGLSRSTKELKRDVLRMSKAAGREDELLFQLADTNSDWNLSFDEFKALVTARLPKLAADTELNAKLESWYKALDANGDGAVTNHPRGVSSGSQGSIWWRPPSCYSTPNAQDGRRLLLPLCCCH